MSNSKKKNWLDSVQQELIKRFKFNAKKIKTVRTLSVVLFLKTPFILVLLLVSLSIGFSKKPSPRDGHCGSPINVIKTGQTSNSVSFAWDSVENAIEYRVKYVRQEDGYLSPEFTTSSLNFTFTNLLQGTYRFYFSSVCGEGVSQFIITEDLIMI